MTDGAACVAAWRNQNYPKRCIATAHLGTLPGAPWRSILSRSHGADFVIHRAEPFAPAAGPVRAAAGVVGPAMTANPAPIPGDPLKTLWEYRPLAPWSLRELSALAGAILEASNVYPVNTVARAIPSDRTIRFYISRGLVSPPEGRGTSAIYMYRHLLQVLAIKLRQMEGATLDTIRDELAGLAGDVVERRVAAALGPTLPSPEMLGWPRRRHATPPPPPPLPERGGGSATSAAGSTVRRIVIAPGCELLIDAGHAYLRGSRTEEELAAAVRRLLAKADTP